RRGADEAGHEYVRRVVVHLPGGTHLLQDTELEHAEPVTHGQGLGLVVGDVHGGDTQAALQGSDLRTGLHAQLGVQVGQRLVHQEDLRLTHDRAAHGHTLTLTTGERLGLAVQVFAQVEDLGRFLHPLADLALVHTRDLQGEAHVVRHGHVRVQRVVLEHHGDVPVLAIGLTHDRAAHGHTLPLTAGERLGLAVQVFAQVEDLGRFLHPLADLALVHTRDLQGEAHVVRHGHVRVQRVVLEHHGDVPVL